jgi:hypothetical protein
MHLLRLLAACLFRVHLDPEYGNCKFIGKLGKYYIYQTTQHRSQKDGSYFKKDFEIRKATRRPVIL